MAEKGDPLMELVADTQKTNRELLLEVLRGRLTLDLNAETVNLLPEARSAKSARRMILLALLGQKALSLLKPDTVADAVAPKALEEVTGLKGNTVRPLLLRLVSEGFIVRRPGKRYAVNNGALHLVAGAITHNTD